MKRSTIPAKQTARTTVIPQVALPCAGDWLRAVRECVDTVRSLDDAALFMISNGVFCINDSLPLFETLESVAEAVTDLKAELARVKKLVVAIRNGRLTEVQSEALGDLEDQFIRVGNECAEGGYLLGLAVGMRLTPDAFRVGAR